MSILWRWQNGILYLPHEFSSNLIQQNDFTKAKPFGRSLLFSLIQQTNNICQRIQSHFHGCYQPDRGEQHISQSQLFTTPYNINTSFSARIHSTSFAVLPTVKWQRTQLLLFSSLVLKRCIPHPSIQKEWKHFGTQITFYSSGNINYNSVA